VGLEDAEDLQDVWSPKYGQLKVKKGWWALELIPLHMRYQRVGEQSVGFVF
jgi:hypothetical protein